MSVTVALFLVSACASTVPLHPPKVVGGSILEVSTIRPVEDYDTMVPLNKDLWGDLHRSLSLPPMYDSIDVGEVQSIPLAEYVLSLEAIEQHLSARQELGKRIPNQDVLTQDAVFNFAYESRALLIPCYFDQVRDRRRFPDIVPSLPAPAGDGKSSAPGYVVEVDMDGDPSIIDTENNRRIGVYWSQRQSGTDPDRVQRAAKYLTFGLAEGNREVLEMIREVGLQCAQGLPTTSSSGGNLLERVQKELGKQGKVVLRALVANYTRSSIAILSEATLECQLEEAAHQITIKLPVIQILASNEMQLLLFEGVAGAETTTPLDLECCTKATLYYSKGDEQKHSLEIKVLGSTSGAEATTASSAEGT